MTQSSRVLATRCPHCHTVFRVVADQLKLRDGLVRCGNCREVFDGRVYLCDPPSDASDDASTGAAETTSATGTALVEDASLADAVATSDIGAPDVAGESLAATSPSPVPEPAQSLASISPPANESSASGAPSASSGRPPVPEMLTPTAIAALLGSPDESRAQMHHGPGRYIDDDPTVLAAPTAQNTSIPRSEPPMSPTLTGQPQRPGAARVIWRVLLTLAILGLIAQWAWIERAAVIDRVPALRGVFAAIGRPMHVTIAPPRQPDMIQISSVTLVTDEATAGDTADTSDTTASAASASPGNAVPMTLTVFIRNQADYALAWPSLELTLSDLEGKPVVRRVFAASDYVTDSALREAGLASRNERTIRLRLSAQAALASNYRVLAFYP
ncbi:DUF3426 domain-containing protein [Pandoraea fibrosis]|uniref:DUF3426 domain-containing protein n=1 Tax=Pandoraea fibrosis TaxID=1891094 RepID=A0ABX6HPY8_9BURK|nr:DUF3426 domain-containing protein [Pandoraea fibrosis]QHE94106.1 DUF3426 domain-containing protein [Pandoraea fibrosis]QHF12330.1 DUF3426 domain-containing protein [Pandoraea fibrosis]